jgi:hypothetical protein
MCARERKSEDVGRRIDRGQTVKNGRRRNEVSCVMESEG